MHSINLILLSVLTVIYSCGRSGNTLGEKFDSTSVQKLVELINLQGNTIETRFNIPDGYSRIEADETSFQAYLRNLPLKPHGSKVYLYNGNLKANQSAHIAVVDMDVGKYNLQQCADAIMRLRAEYLYSHRDYDKIHFNFTNGFRVDYSKWMEGNRMVVKGNKSYWVHSVEPSNSYDDFREFLYVIFTYAGSLSLSKELVKINYSDIQPGDILIQGGSPGHAAIVIDMVINKSSGKKLYLLAQSFMPAQEIHILKNPANNNSPWYELDIDVKVVKTPEWTFQISDLKRFKEE